VQRGLKVSVWLVEKHVRFWSFLGLHMGKEIFSTAEVLAAGLLRTNMTACEAIKCKDVFKKVCRLREKKLQKLDIEPDVPRWRGLPGRIDNGSDNTRFTSTQQCFTTQHLQVVGLIVNKIEERLNQESFAVSS